LPGGGGRTHLVGAGHHGPERGEVRVDPLPPPPLRLAVALERHRRLLGPAVSLPLRRLQQLRGGSSAVRLLRSAVRKDRRRRRAQLAKSILIISMATAAAAAETTVEPVEELRVTKGYRAHAVVKSFQDDDDDPRPRGTRT
jgi:hypothetical protein